MIIVTGATGTLNGAAVDHLLRRLPAEQIGVSVRTPARAQHLADRGVTVRQGSYDDPAALRDSFAGAEQVLLVSSSDRDADVLAQHRNAIDAAVDAGAQRILYTSTVGAGFDTPYPPLALHAATEDHLAGSGVAWTALRNGLFGDLSALLGPWQSTGRIAQPADGPLPWVDRRDAGEAAAAILAGETVAEGPIDLVPDHAADMEAFAAAASELTGRQIERVVVDDETWVADQVAAGVPELAARFSLSMFQAAREGFFDRTGEILGELLGRAPRGITEMLAERLAE